MIPIFYYYFYYLFYVNHFEVLCNRKNAPGKKLILNLINKDKLILS